MAGTRMGRAALLLVAAAAAAYGCTARTDSAASDARASTQVARKLGMRQPRGVSLSVRGGRYEIAGGEMARLHASVAAAVS